MEDHRLASATGSTGGGGSSRRPPPPRILVVDDEPGMVRAVSRVLQQAYVVESTSQPEAAPDLAARFRPDLAILDIRMPGMDGFTLMRKLLERDPQLDVILMTGNFDEADADLIQAIETGAFFYLQKPIDRRVLLALVARCVERRSLQQERDRHRERMAGELRSAQRFQQSLLPPTHQSTAYLEVDSLFHACTELAGDFFDYVFLDERRLVLLVADIVGHGAPAAMMVGLIKWAFRAAHGEGYDPLVVTRNIHAALEPFDECEFVTTFCALLEHTGEPRIRYVSAGHPAALLLEEAGTRELGSTSPFISSLFSADEYCEASVHVDHNARLFVYTDGLTEAHNAHGPFGQVRLTRLLRQLNPGDERLLAKIEQQVLSYTRGHPFADDVTMVSVRWKT